MPPPEAPTDPSQLPAGDLVRELVADAALLVQRQVKLARLETLAQLARQKRAAGLMGAAVALAYAALVILLTLGAFAVGDALRVRALGPLLVALVLVGGAALLFVAGWHRRVRAPLAQSLGALGKEVTWFKSHMATH